MKKNKNIPEAAGNRDQAVHNSTEAVGQQNRNYDKQGDDTESEEMKRQFHPAFCAAMELELREDKEHLIFEKEYHLNTKPNQIDLLIINADTNIRLKSELGAIFRKHNIFEFKSPDDMLDVKIYHRTMGYAYLYVAYGKKVPCVDDITLSFLRASYPRELMKWFKSRDFHIEIYADGIYHITKSGHVDMQVIAADQLRKGYAWINKLTSGLELEDLLQMQKELRTIKDEDDRMNAESVMDLSLSLNAKKEWVKELVGMGVLKDMLDEERRKMREEFDEEARKVREEAKEEVKQEVKEEVKQEVKEEVKQEVKQEVQEEYQEKLKYEQEKNKRLCKEIEELRQQLKEQMGKLAMM